MTSNTFQKINYLLNIFHRKVFLTDIYFQKIKYEGGCLRKTLRGGVYEIKITSLVAQTSAGIAQVKNRSICRDLSFTIYFGKKVGRKIFFRPRSSWGDGHFGLISGKFPL